jgi:anti-sigma factor RsiW
MTPQLARQLEVATSAHLTEDQFGELLAGDAQQPIPAPVQAHLLACQKCAAELAGLRESLSFFQQATGAYADNELRHLPQASLPDRPMRSPVLASALEPAYWLAAAVLLAGFLPMQTAHRNALPPAPAVASSNTAESQSDEALLNDVDSELSASVPASMQALVDPSTDDTDISAQTSTQRKD